MFRAFRGVFSQAHQTRAVTAITTLRATAQNTRMRAVAVGSFIQRGIGQHRNFIAVKELRTVFVDGAQIFVR